MFLCVVDVKKIFKNVSGYKTITTGRYITACDGRGKQRKTRFFKMAGNFLLQQKQYSGIEDGIDG